MCECFLTKFNRRSSKISDWSFFKQEMIFEPRLTSPWTVSVSFCTVRGGSAAGPQIYCSSSSLFVVKVYLLKMERWVRLRSQ